MVSFRFCKTLGYFGDVPLGPHPRKLCFAFGPKTTGWQQPTLVNDQSFHDSPTTHSLTPSHFSAGKYRFKYSCQGGPFFFESFDGRLVSLRSQGGNGRSGVINSATQVVFPLPPEAVVSNQMRFSVLIYANRKFSCFL